MSNKDNDIHIIKKILFSFWFPFLLLFHCILFLVPKINRNEKLWWNSIIYSIREEYERDNFKVIGYSFFPIMFTSILYILYRCPMLEPTINNLNYYVYNIWDYLVFRFSTVGIFSIILISIILSIVALASQKKVIMPIYFFLLIITILMHIIGFYFFNAWNDVEPKDFFSITLAIGAILISIIIALVLKKRKIENGDQFLDQLNIHINYLSHLPGKHIIYIISPNINFGTWKNKPIGQTIEKNKNISFIFVCKSINIDYLNSYKSKKNIMDEDEKRSFFKEANKNSSNMLDYLYTRYTKYMNGEVKNLDDLIIELLSIVNYDNVELVEEYDKLFELDKDLRIGGYLSDFECVFGTYIDIKENKVLKEVHFNGELIRSYEFIEFVKKQIMRMIGNGEQFMKHIYNHIESLQKENEKQELYIISPNVTIGIGKKYHFADVIEKNKNIQFKFICKTIEINSLNGYPEGDYNKDSIANIKLNFIKNICRIPNNDMLRYMYERYVLNDRWETFEESIEVLKRILDIEKNGGNVEIIQKYDEIYKNKNIGGYLSNKECVLGFYENIESEKGRILYRGETIISSEFIGIVKSYVLDKVK